MGIVTVLTLCLVKTPLRYVCFCSPASRLFEPAKYLFTGVLSRKSVFESGTWKILWIVDSLSCSIYSSKSCNGGKTALRNADFRLRGFFQRKKLNFYENQNHVSLFRDIHGARVYLSNLDVQYSLTSLESGKGQQKFCTPE